MTPGPERPAVRMAPMALKTLIVEDDDRIRAALRLALGEEGYEVVEAADVAQGLEVYEREQPDVSVGRHHARRLRRA